MSTELAPQNPVSVIKRYPVAAYIDVLISIMYLYTRPKKGYNKNTIYLAELISALGHTMISRWNLPVNSALAAKIGAFYLYSFDKLGILEVILGQGRNGHNAYIVRLIKDDVLVELWQSLPATSIEKLPSKTPYPDWVSSEHANGTSLVKTKNKMVLESLTAETHPLVFECVNRAQKVGWRVNKRVYSLEQWALKTKQEAFQDIWNAHSREARATKGREAKAILSIATKFLNDTFYHLYYYDFRGRKYAATAYLHEQGSDIAKGMLLRSDAKPIGSEGFKWLLISIASNWGGECGHPEGAKSDKIPLLERFEWALANEDTFLEYAANPKESIGWMRADKPWQFIAACLELYKLRMWQLQMEKHVNAKGDPFQNYGYVSHLEAYIDGTNNGSQHLAALTRDEITAPHVNLTPSVMPGDLYGFIAKRVWSNINEDIASLSPEERIALEEWIDATIDLRKQIQAQEPGVIKDELLQLLRCVREDLAELEAFKAPVFWARIVDNKSQRKIVKRNVMTLPYGGTPFGLGQQQIDDARKHKINLLFYMEHKWGAYMGRCVYEECRNALRRPSQLLTLFEKAGKTAENNGLFLNWPVPITNFPVVQHYTEGKVKKIWVQYGPKEGELKSTGYYDNALQLLICFFEDVKPSKGKQSQGAAPNVTHSLDAAHLVLIVCRSECAVTTVHDSFGTLLCDMPELFKNTRETFVELYNVNPITTLFKHIGADISQVEFGTLDINLVLESEYCFS